MYVFGDIVTGRIFCAPADSLANGRLSPFAELKLRDAGRDRSLLDMLGDTRADLRFGTDERGGIYLLTKRDGGFARSRPPHFLPTRPFQRNSG